MSWSIEAGYSHKCRHCGKTWYDSDGGCQCGGDESEEIDKKLENFIRAKKIMIRKHKV